MPHRLSLGLIYSLGAIVAILCAYLIGLDHPQWAGMTVWAVAQPARGAMLEKILYRLGGTILGVGAGLVIIALSGGVIFPLALLLTLWVALCTWRGNSAFSHLAYFWLLSGYSASMVALLDFGSTDPTFALGLDRFLTVSTGLLIGGLFAAIFVPRAAAHPADLAIEQPLSGETLTSDAVRKRLARLATLEAALELGGAGSLRRHAEAAKMRGDILRLSWQLRHPNSAPAAQPDFGTPRLNTRKAHRDHLGARHAALRVLGLLLPLTLFWTITEISIGPYLLLGASVMISIFSNFEAPHRMMPWVFTGQIIAGTLSIGVHWLLWPFAPNELVQILMLAPVLLAAALAFAHPFGLKMALDIAMVGLLLSPIGLPYTSSFSEDIARIFAIISAPLLAYIAFLMVFRTGPEQRKRNARKLILAELALFASGRRALPQDSSWHLRHEQRALRLAHGGLSVEDLALLRFAEETYLFLHNRPLTDRRFKLVAARLGRLHTHPSQALTALEKWAGRPDLVALARKANL